MTADQLKTLRTTLGLTQPQLAARIGVQPNTVYRWEAGIHPISRPMQKLIEHVRDEPR